MSYKIAQIITQAEMGGAQKHLLILSDELKKLDNCVTVYAGEGQGLDKELEQLNIDFKRIELLKREISLLNDFKAIIKLMKIFKKEKYDIVHCHSSKAGLVGRIAARLAGVKIVVYTAHGFVFNEPMSKIKKRLYIIIEKIGSLFGNKLIAVSKKDYNCALDYGFGNKKNIYYIPNAVHEIDRASLNNREELKKQLGIENTFVLGVLANFYETKGHKFLIDALLKLTDEGYSFSCIFVGEGTTKNDMVKRAKGYTNMKFLGYRKDNYDLINCMDLFVLPSVKEGMPYVILEAMTLSKPVLCTRVGALTDMIEDCKNGFIVAPESSEQLYNKLKYIFEHKDILNKIGKKGYNYYKENFTVDLFIRDVLKVYNITMESR
ncbi:glycosyltransferase family 4 protein [Clostridium manihotivorum]|uniref:Glycosyltransferase family 1 protein n=1 Tax=Clostridium manihotivorum TaxID=2320868 RepID=A0A410DSK0_9CLOT|nr:glycosyltransferase family 4 protein [Clostridium manihotivorum]QAA32017.1 hypothetical protein C1I91_10330 [Clostridium manihotivorum]